MRTNRTSDLPARSVALESLEVRRLLSAMPVAAAELRPVSIRTDVRASPRVSASRVAVRNASGIFTTSQDIGSPALAGSTSFNAGTYTITAGGTDIGGSSDQFHYAYNALTGDVTLAARVVSITNTNASAKAGVMFRSSDAADAAFAGIFVTPGNNTTFMTRSADGSAASQTIAGGVGAPRYVRLTRVGLQFTAFYSADAINWTQLGSTQTVAIGSSPLGGLAVTSRNVAATTTATLTNVTLLPAGASAVDIGSPALAGSAGYDAATNRFTLSASGTGIGGTSDQLHLVSRAMTGDGSVVARIDAVTNTDPAAAGGVMIRDSVAAGAAFASVSFTAGGSVVFQWRVSTGAAASASSIGAIAGPVWVRLARASDVFSASYSTDGVTWTAVGSPRSVPMTSATALAGIWATSHTNSQLASATFSGVSHLQAAFSTRDIGSPLQTGSATYDAPSNTYTLAGVGTEIGASSDQFTFASRTMTGDGTVVTYLNSISSADPAAKAGVMIRGGNGASAAFAGLFATRGGNVVFQYRGVAGGATSTVTSPGIAAPVSLRIVRSGQRFTAAYSTNGTSWITVGLPQILPMATTALAGVAVASHDPAVLASAAFTGVAAGKNLPPGAGIFSSADELFLHDLSNRSVRFFYDETNPATGLVPDGALANGGSNGSACSIASLGFGLSALTIGDQRGWLTHSQAYQRALTTVNFLYNTAQHVNGFYYHFLSTTTGQRAGFSELSSIDTAELMAGVLNVAEYWKGTAVETTAMNIFNRVNWPWFQKPNGQFYGAWSPENGFEYGYSDFSEAAVLYMLGLGSSTHPIAPSSWLAWGRSPVVFYGGMSFITAQGAALFTVQYPQAWYDLRGLVDATGLNYYLNAQTATLAQRQMCIDMSGTYPQWGPNVWGLTAADGPSGYTVYGGPPASGNIDGTVVPTAPGGSLAFVPKQTVDALRHMQQTYGSTIYKKYGFVDAFNPGSGWTSSIVLGIDVGMMLLAAENARSNFVWDVFQQSAVAAQSKAIAFQSATPVLQSGLSRKVAGGVVNEDLPLEVDGDVSIEPRQGGPTQILLGFAGNVVKGPGFAVSLGGAGGSVVSSSTSGSTLTINLTGVADKQVLYVNIADLRINGSALVGGDYSLAIGSLVADATRDGVVDISDLAVLATNWQATGATSAQGDLNSDRVVDISDLALLATNWQASIPVPPPLSLFGATPIEDTHSVIALLES